MNRSIRRDYDIYYNLKQLEESGTDILVRIQELQDVGYNPIVQLDEIIECLAMLRERISVEM